MCIMCILMCNVSDDFFWGGGGQVSLVLLDLPLMISSVADTDLQHDSYAYNPPEIFVFNSICEGIFLMIFDNGVPTGCKRGRLVPPIAWQKRCNEKYKTKGEGNPGRW